MIRGSKVSMLAIILIAIAIWAFYELLIEAADGPMGEDDNNEYNPKE